MVKDHKSEVSALRSQVNKLTARCNRLESKSGNHLTLDKETRELVLFRQKELVKLDAKKASIDMKYKSEQRKK